MIKKYWNRHFQFDNVFDPSGSNIAAGTAPVRRKKSRSFKLFVLLLKALPWLCVGTFIFSFFWDFGPKDAINIAGVKLGLEAMLRMVAISGLIGFSTNWVAIKMLFKPVFRRPIWGQGLIPAQKDRIVYNLAGGIHRHILNEDMIQARIEESGLIPRFNKVIIDSVESLLQDEEFRRETKVIAYKLVKENLARDEVRDKLTTLINSKLEANLQTGLKGFVFKTYKALNRDDYQGLLNNVLDRIPGMVVEVLEELENEREHLLSFLKEKEPEMQAFFSRMIIDVLERIDIRSLLSKQMAHFDEKKLEEMIWNATNEQLLYIQYLGTLLGIMGGFLIWQPTFMLITYATVFGGLFVADILLHRINQQASA